MNSKNTTLPPPTTSKALEDQEKSKLQPANAGEYMTLDPGLINFSETNLIFRDPMEFTAAALQDLASSIIENGLVQPIVVRRTVKGSDKRFILVAGERRLRAWLLAKFVIGIPAIVKDLDDEQALKVQFIENLQRENINPMMEANGFNHMVSKGKYTTRQIADELGKSIDYVQERMRLSSLIPALQELVRTGELPLKAGLKMARIPEAQQKECMDEVTDILHLGKGKKVVFAGLDKLQYWMDEHLFTDLTAADFDKEDTKLNPSMGACSTCIHRSKNTGGLFDDITIEDKCLLASCYRTKQVNTYKNLHADLSRKFPDFAKRIVFRERTNMSDGKEIFKKSLSPIAEVKGAGAGEEITQAQAAKNKDASLAILIGSETHWGGTAPKAKTKYIFTKPKERAAAAPYMSTSERIKAAQEAKATKDMSPQAKAKAEQKAKDAKTRELYQEAAQERLTFSAIIAKHSPAMATSAQREVLIEFFSECLWNNDGQEVSIFKELGIDFTLERKGKKVHMKAKDLDVVALKADDSLRSLDGAAFADAIEKVKGPTLDSLFMCLLYMHSPSTAVKLFHVDPKSIKAKAVAETSAWWSRKQAAALQSKAVEKVVWAGGKKKKGGAKK